MRMIGVRWQMAILLCLITTVNYIDRQAFAVAGPVIVEEFSLSNAEFGFILSGFFFAYAIGQLVVGPIIDRLGTRRAFSVAVIAWSLAGMACALGRGFWSFFAYRSLLGATEATNFPAALKSVAEWFPRAERSMAIGIVTLGPGLGAILSPPLLGYLIATFGWQWAFLVPGAVGFVWVWIWRLWYFPPAEHPRLSAEERALILADQPAEEAVPATPEPWYAFVRFFRYKEVWGLMISRLFHDGAFYFFVSWLPLYLAQERGFDIKQIAIFAWIPFLAADLGSLSGGWTGQQLIRRGYSVDRSRRLTIWGGALVIPLTLPAVAVDSAYVAIALIAASMFAIQFKSANLFALPTDLFPARQVATIWGLFGAVGSFGGMLFNAWAGWITEAQGYMPVFIAVGVTQIISVIVINWLVPRIELLEPSGTPRAAAAV